MAARSKILMIDDNPQGLAARRIILQDLGYDVTTAEDGERGLRWYVECQAEAPFSLVITDYRMPQMRGDEFIGRLRELGSDVPVVILSGYTSMLALTPESTGAHVVLSKGPHEQFDLVDTVLRLVPEGARQHGKPPASERGFSTPRHTGQRRRRFK